MIAGDSHKVEIPREEMEVVKGQMVVLQAWYSPSSDISKNTVIWHFIGNESKQVRRKLKKHTHTHTKMCLSFVNDCTSEVHHPLTSTWIDSYDHL